MKFGVQLAVAGEKSPAPDSDLSVAGTLGFFPFINCVIDVCMFFVAVPRSENLQTLFTECHGTRGMYAIKLHSDCQ